MTFDQLLSAAQSGHELIIPPGWKQGPVTFGGLTTSLIFARMQALVAEGRSVRSLQTSFVGPVKAEVPVVFEAEILREGKAVSQVMGRIVQSDEVRLVCLASFSGDRESVIRVDPLPAPEVADVEQCRELPYIKGVTPEFLRHVSMRWALGAFPFTGQGGREMGGWIRFSEPPATFTDAHLIALVDAWPPAVLSLAKGLLPASSLNWTLDIVHPRPEIMPDDWLLYRVVIDQAALGYSHTRAGIWTARGELVALSNQTVAVFG
ncbi:MAG TPA: thioesterase family protein [Marinobacter sp.]|nr:thioesterase family protein [Marinobacter sp.]